MEGGPQEVVNFPSDTLMSFVPDLLARRIGDGSGPHREWSSEACEMAVLGLDISESTSIIEDLVRWSPDGSETIAHALNAVFALLTDVIVEHHGSVITLAGDEVVALWRASEAGGRAASVQWAARAAIAVQERIAAVSPVAGYPIRLRAGIGCGTAWLLDVGRERGQRVFVAVGRAMQDMAAAQKDVAASEIGLSEDARSLLGDSATVEPSTSHPSFGRLTAVQPAPGTPPAPHPRVSVPPALARPYVPRGVFEQLRSGPEFHSELAPVTAMFISFRLRPWDDEAIKVVSEAALQALDILDKYDGTIINAAQDLGGLTLVAGFGLPPDVREREASRANVAALEISRTTQEFVEHGIGIGTGHAFCGVFGSPTYRQYMMVGPVVNLAARLMQRAQNEVLCDEVSQHLSRDRLRFSARGPMDMKGFAGPIEVYRPEWHESDPGLPTLRRLAGESGDLVTRGREREREELAGRLVALSLGTSTAVIVEGEPGVGKTHLAVDLLRASGGYGHITVLAGGGDDVDPRPYRAWKRVFTNALGLSSVRQPHKRALLVEERLSHSPELRAWVPLLNEILDLDLDDSALRGMSGPSRRENTLRVLVQLLTDVARATPLLILLDDCQFMDSSSWELVRAVHRGVEPVMMVLLTRPMPEATPSWDGDDPEGTASGTDAGAVDTATEVTTYLRGRGARLLSLGPLPPHVTEQIARDFLGAETLDEPVAALFRDKVDGSPLFTVELAFQLRSEGIISIVGAGERARARLDVPPGELARLRLPVRVEEVFRARLAAVSERQRLVIRAAGVIGRSFDEQRILAADPHVDPRTLAEDLRHLERNKVIEAQPNGWRFTHTLIRDVALQSFLPSALRQRHRALAEWYEAHESKPDNYAILARHWAEAGDPAREILYLEAAGTNALAKGADEEAASLLEAALALDEDLEPKLPTVSDARRAFWHEELAEALADENRLEESILHYRKALGLLGHAAVPRTRLGWTARLVVEVLTQIVHLFAPPRLVHRGDAATLGQAAHTLSMLAETYYFKGEALPWVATVLAAVNRAERARNEGLAGPAYSGLGNLVGTLRLHRLAARYLLRSRSKVTDQPTGTDNPLVRGVLPDRAWQYDLTATVAEAVYLRTMNRSRDVTPMLDSVVQSSRRSGQNQDLEICLAARGFFSEVHGSLRPARADYEELLISARRRGNAEHVIWGLALLVPTHLSLDRRAEAMSLDEEAVEAFSEEFTLFGLVFRGSHVLALTAQGQFTDALADARRALKGLGVVPFIHLPGLTAVAQACIEILEKEHGSSLEKEARHVSLRALRALRRYVRLYPFARARYELYLGRYLSALGRNRAARRHWNRGLGAAKDAGLMLDGARIRMLLAAGFPEGSAPRVEHLRQSRRDIDELGLRRLKEFEGLARIPAPEATSGVSS
jgi:class 3 adenylate cyclase/tetratricopeptide (TPR) repeat protein